MVYVFLFIFDTVNNEICLLQITEYELRLCSAKSIYHPIKPL